MQLVRFAHLDARTDTFALAPYRHRFIIPKASFGIRDEAPAAYLLTSNRASRYFELAGVQYQLEGLPYSTWRFGGGIELLTSGEAHDGIVCRFRAFVGE